MNRRMALSVIVMMFMVSVGLTTIATGYSTYIDNETVITWNVEKITNFTMWYTEGGYCAALNDSTMEFSASNVDDEVSGTLSIGNVSVATNDTMIALDLTLGVWPDWLPGLIIEVGQNNINTLNETAYAAAERIAGNWMNGTMVSKYENITIGLRTEECIVFDYLQDSPGTQVTHLAYSLSSGVLVEANTTVTFTSTYLLVVSLSSINNPTIVDLTPPPFPGIILAGIIGGGLIAVIVLIFIQISRRK
ncbi:MAG: hypothetical protein OEV85_03025 [Candidatus Thorarchaeota archaeon]|nr:hypothetical protein [Candidatus Thorarchaeota archaeon]